jgi:hypothetical protein
MEIKMNHLIIWAFAELVANALISIYVPWYNNPELWHWMAWITGFDLLIIIYVWQWKLN